MSPMVAESRSRSHIKSQLQPIKRQGRAARGRLKIPAKVEWRAGGSARFIAREKIRMGRRRSVRLPRDAARKAAARRGTDRLTAIRKALSKRPPCKDIVTLTLGQERQ